MSKKTPHTWVGELLHGDFKKAFDQFKDFSGGGESIGQALEQGWNGLEPELQNALVNGSGIVDELGKDLDKIPSEVWPLIKSRFPALTEDAIKSVLQGIQTELTNVQAVITDTPEQTISNLQVYFKGKEQTKVGLFFSHAAQFAASILSPTSVIGKIISYMEMAYQVFVKK